jgi:hypothetical protein
MSPMNAGFPFSICGHRFHRRTCCLLADVFLTQVKEFALEIRFSGREIDRKSNVDGAEFGFG